MKYSFRPNLFQRHCGLLLSAEELQLLDSQEGVTRRIRLTDIRSLQRVDCGSARTPDGRRESMEQCVVRHGGRELVIRSASYAGPREWDSHGPAYRRFVADLMDRVARQNPSAKVTCGSGVLTGACHLIQIAAVCLIVIGLFTALSVLRDGNISGEGTMVAAVSLVGGIGAFAVSGSFAAVHRPVTTDVTTARAQ